MPAKSSFFTRYFGTLSIILIYLTKRYFLKEDILDFNSGKGTWISDIAWGLLLVIIYFTLFYVERLTLSGLLNYNANRELLGLMLDMRKSPILMILWFGPVLWFGVALYEELVRVFMLTSLWPWSEHRLWQFMAIIIAAIVIGLTHWSQGSYGIVTISIKSMVSGYYFYRQRRLMPLVYAHALYDGIQVGALLMTYPD